jgi:hypothetical protein
MNEERKNEGLIKDSYELVIKEFQTVISVFYLVLVGIGMIFTFYKYSEFGINIFQYADAFDFLIAPFQDIFIIVFALLSTLIPYVLWRYDSYLKNNKPEIYSKYNFGLEKKSWFNALRVILYTSLFIYYLSIAGSKYGTYFKNKIQDQSSLSVLLQDENVEQGKLIGKTKDIIFLLVDKKVIAIPINSSVTKIEIQ